MKLRNLKPLKTSIILMIILVFSAVTGTTQAGHASSQLEKAGYECFNDGPHNWKHCWREEKIGNPVIPVKVFSVDGSEFLGTELLLRDDIYAGQPCPQDGLALWNFLDFGAGLGYFACHQFNTGP